MEPISLGEFATLTRVAAAEIEHYTAAGLLDPGSTGQFNELDVLRVYVVRSELAAGRMIGDVVADLRAAGSPILRRLFPSGPSHSIGRTATILDLDESTLADLATALGFRHSMATEETTALYEAALRLPVEWEAFVEGARVFGDAVRRIAEVGVAIIHRSLCDPLAASGGDDVDAVDHLATSCAYLAGEVTAIVDGLLVNALLDAISEHTAAHLLPRPSTDRPSALHRTIVFVDLAASSALAETEGDDALFELIDRLDLAVRAIALAHGGRLVKEDGDGFMLSFLESAAAVRFAIEVEAHVTATEPLHISTRIGMHSGPVLFRLGDYYGQAVNVAHRVSSMAMPHTILVTGPVADAAADAGVTFDDIGVRNLRGMDAPLPILRVRTSSPV